MNKTIFFLLMVIFPVWGFSATKEIPLCQENKDCFYVSPQSLSIRYNNTIIFEGQPADLTLVQHLKTDKKISFQRGDL